MDDKKCFAIFRVQKLFRGGGKNSVFSSIRHLENHDKGAAELAHPELSKHNKTMQSDSFMKNPTKVISKLVNRHNKNSVRKLRKDASICAEMIFSYSPSAKTLDFIEEYEKRILLFLKKEFPNFKTVRLDRHCDEESVHWHVVGICFADETHQTLSSAKCLGGRSDFREHQTAFAEMVADLGVSRGIPKEITKSNHKTKEEHNRLILLNEKEEQQKAIEEVFGFEK